MLHFGAANFVEVLLYDEEATATVEDKIPEQQPVEELVEATEGIGIVTGKKWEDAVTPYEKPRVELSDTKEEHVDAAEDKISAEVVEATKEIDNIPELNEEAATIQQDQAPLADEETDDLHEAADDQIVAELVEAVQDLEKTATLVAEDINIENKSDAEVEEPFTYVLPPSTIEDDPVNQRMIVSCTDEQQTYVTQPASKLVDVLVEVSQQEDPSSRTEYGMEIRGDDSRVEAIRMELPDSFMALDDSSMVSMQVDCHASPKPYYIDSSMRTPEEVGAMPLRQHSIALDQDLVAEAKVVVPVSDQPLSDMEVVVLNKNIVQDELEETSSAAGSADKHKESPRLSSISEVVPSATSKSKEIVVGPKAALCDCAVENEFQNSPTTIEDSESSKGCGLLETVEEASTDALLLSVDEAFVKQRTKACCTDQPMDPRMGQTDASSLWIEEGCWIYIIQDANGRHWERSCRDFQIHHVQPD
ncbi:unnamed protein product [Sphagnum compactum]